MSSSKSSQILYVGEKDMDINSTTILSGLPFPAGILQGSCKRPQPQPLVKSRLLTQTNRLGKKMRSSASPRLASASSPASPLVRSLPPSLCPGTHLSLAMMSGGNRSIQHQSVKQACGPSTVPSPTLPGPAVTQTQSVGVSG